MASRISRAAPALSAFVLHRYDWSESSLILDVFTRERGRLIVVAKGAKRPHSQLRSVLLPFQRFHAVLGRAPDESNNEVHNLRGADWAGDRSMLTGAALFSGFYLNELLMKLLPKQEPHPTLFDAYARTLPFLASSDDAQVESALRACELFLLRETGVLPDLQCVTLTQSALVSNQRYALDPEAGLRAATGADAGALPAEALIAVQAALNDGDLGALHAACSGALPAWKRALRVLLAHQLGGQMLRSRQALHELHALGRLAV